MLLGIYIDVFFVSSVVAALLWSEGVGGGGYKWFANEESVLCRKEFTKVIHSSATRGAVGGGRGGGAADYWV